MSELTLREAREADHATALTLGIVGTDPAASQARLTAAQALQQEYLTWANSVYENAEPMQDPDPRPPFGLNLLIAHQGDITAVLHDPHLDDELAHELDLNGGSYERLDEFGERVEAYDPGIRDAPEGVAILADAHAKILAAATPAPTENDPEGALRAQLRARRDAQYRAGAELPSRSAAPGMPPRRDGVAQSTRMGR